MSFFNYFDALITQFGSSRRLLLIHWLILQSLNCCFVVSVCSVAYIYTDLKEGNLIRLKLSFAKSAEKKHSCL